MLPIQEPILADNASRIANTAKFNSQDLDEKESDTKVQEPKTLTNSIMNDGNEDAFHANDDQESIEYEVLELEGRQNQDSSDKYLDFDIEQNDQMQGNEKQDDEINESLDVM